MSEWKEYLLEEVIDKFIDYRGKTPNKTLSGIPLVTAKIVKNGTILEPNEFISKEDYDIWMTRGLPEIDDIVLTTEAPLGEIALIKNKNVALAQRIITLRGKKEIVYNPFLKYYFQNKDGQFELQSRASGTTVFGIKASVLRQVPITLPPLVEQKVIATMLLNIDDKIDLLHLQNNTLEKIADTIFRQKFIEEANEDWAIEKLENVAEIQNGYAFSSRDYVEYQENHLEVLKMGHIKRGGGLRTDPKKDFVPRLEKLTRWILKKGDIIMAMTDMKDNVVILGVPAMIDKSDKYVLNQRVARIYLKSTTRLINNYLLYIQLKDSEFITNLQSKANSGVQVNLSTETIKDCDIIIPHMELQEEIGKTITNLYLKKEQNDIQIKTLTSMRDNLLPKLMSREATIQL
jgi:type I restriction enzyme S subunit